MERGLCMCAVIFAQLVVWYRFSEVISSIQYDFSSSGNNAVLGSGSNAPIFAPHGLYFDGVDDYVDMPSNSEESSSLDLSPPITFTLWIIRRKINGTSYLPIFELINSTRTLNFSAYILAPVRYIQLEIQTSFSTQLVQATNTNFLYGEA